MTSLHHIAVFVWFIVMFGTCTGRPRVSGTACENGGLRIRCPYGYVIYITNAMYGRLNKWTCHHKSIHTTYCAAGRSRDIVGAACDGKQYCYIAAKNSVFGDPCYGTYKYLHVGVKCIRRVTSWYRRAVLCENRREWIQCPTGKTISIIRAKYGRSTRHTCPHRSIKTTVCSAKNTIHILKARCNGKRNCYLYATNSVFGDPCRNTYKYLDVMYKCQTATNGHLIAMCQNHAKILTCPYGYVIHVIKAMYGRLNKWTCYHKSIRTTSCAAGRSRDIVGTVCEGRRSCKIAATNRVFGNPCYGTYKYLQMRARCVRKVRTWYKTALLCEGRKGWIHCPYGKTIRIISAKYGRSTRRTCPHRSIKTTFCSARSTRPFLRARCNGRRYCYLSATNSVFGDPCRNTYKYLDVKYSCR